LSKAKVSASLPDESILKNKEPHPSNASITAWRERTWNGHPAPHTLYERAIRLKAPETCWVSGCDNPVYYALYSVKRRHMGYKAETVGNGVDRNCPFLCLVHGLEEMERYRNNRPLHYVNFYGWATAVCFREVLQPLKSKREVVA